MTAIDREGRFSWHHVDGVRLRLDLTKGQYQRIAMLFGFLDRLAADATESVNGIATVAQRRCTRMVGFAVQRYRVATLSYNGADDAYRLGIAFKHATLSDV